MSNADISKLYCCTHCRQEKEISFFYKTSRNVCAKCVFDGNTENAKKSTYKERRKRNYARKMAIPGYRKKYNARHREALRQRKMNPYYLERTLADQCLRNHAYGNGKPIQISVDEYLEKRRNTNICVIDGRSFSNDYKDNAEMDMIDPKGPINYENIRFICKRHNEMKGDMTDHELLKHCKAIVAHLS